MKRHALFLLAVASFVAGTGFLSASGGAKDEAVKKDQLAMSGTWQVLSYEKDGKAMSADQLAKTRSIIGADGQLMVQRDGKTVIKGVLKIDPAKKPKQYEGTYTDGDLKGKAVLGIYLVDGDSLKICYSLPGKDRPTEFSASSGSGHVYINYKRAKP